MSNQGLWHQLQKSSSSYSNYETLKADIYKMYLQALPVKDPTRTFTLHTGSKGAELIGKLFKIRVATETLKDLLKDNLVNTVQYETIITMLKSNSESDQDLGVSIVETIQHQKSERKSNITKLLNGRYK